LMCVFSVPPCQGGIQGCLPHTVNLPQPLLVKEGSRAGGPLPLEVGEPMKHLSCLRTSSALARGSVRRVSTSGPVVPAVCDRSMTVASGGTGGLSASGHWQASCQWHPREGRGAAKPASLYIYVPFGACLRWGCSEWSSPLPNGQGARYTLPHLASCTTWTAGALISFHPVGRRGPGVPVVRSKGPRFCEASRCE